MLKTEDESEKKRCVEKDDEEEEEEEEESKKLVNTRMVPRLQNTLEVLTVLVLCIRTAILWRAAARRGRLTMTNDHHQATDTVRSGPLRSGQAQAKPARPGATTHLDLQLPEQIFPSWTLLTYNFDVVSFRFVSFRYVTLRYGPLQDCNCNCTILTHPIPQAQHLELDSSPFPPTPTPAPSCLPGQTVPFNPLL